MAKNLVIVESPAKAKTIARYLGSDFEVKSSFGHIRDLPKKQIGVDVKNNFTPTYEVSPDKLKVAKELKTAAKGKTVWLASDEDREGEAIAWHICYVLDIDPAKTKRIVFHEITESAITAAVANPRIVDQKLVDAQQARRVLDRLVGYELSPILWKKIRAGLSAGRVQSVAVRLTVEREKEIKTFSAEASFKLQGILTGNAEQIPAELPSKIPTEPAANEFLEALKTAKLSVESIDQKPAIKSPAAPFTTSTLQQEAARRMGYGVKQTMMLAQRLYENGHITYMRTDSVNLSDLAIKAAKDYILKNYGEKYYQVRQYQTKSRGAQEAHEAIRPTNLSALACGADAQQQKLYELIWRRTLASQMTQAQIDKTEAQIAISNRPEKLLAKGEVLKFDGYLKVYVISSPDSESSAFKDKILPKLSVGQELNLESMTAEQVYSRAAARYSEASLVKKLEELGIGRPSTYAPTISTIQTRGYVEKIDVEGKPIESIELILSGGEITKQTKEVLLGTDRGKLVPTQLAEIVTDFLIKYFSSIVDYDFTAKAEDELDDIADGKIKWEAMIDGFYKSFHPLIETSKDASRDETLQVRELGIDPKTKKIVYARYGRFGPVLQLGENPEKGDKEAPKPKFAPMPKDAELDSVTLEQALPMFAFPRVVGTAPDGEEVTANIGPYGPYVKIGKQFVSIKEADPLTISLSEALELIAEKKTALAQKVIADFGTVKILNGLYGPYITDGKKNAKIPKDVEPKDIDEAQAKKFLAEAPAKKGRFRRSTKK